MDGTLLDIRSPNPQGSRSLSLPFSCGGDSRTTASLR